MITLALVLIYFVAFLHFGFMVLESFFWTRPIGLKIFGLRPESAKATKSLAINQGVYNGFLAAGLVWGACSQNLKINIFFLICVIIAGIVGGITVSKKILLVQSLPAVAA